MVWDGYILGGNFLLDGTSGKYFIKHFAAFVNKDSPISICKRWLVEYTLFGNFDEIWLGMTCLHEIENEPELRKI